MTQKRGGIMQRIIEKVEFKIPEQTKMLRVAAYARVSSGKDAMLHSLSAQVSYYSNLIQNHKGWIYCGVYADEAKTGTKDTRENFHRLLEECRAGKIDLVITKSVSRFARNSVTLLETVRELKSLGVDVYFEEQRINTISADGELMMTILASYAQEESYSASENQKWRIRKQFEQGRDVNIRFLFGYKVCGEIFEPDPETAPIVVEIFNRYVEGASFTELAKDLNKRGVRCSLGGLWDCQRIKGIITNEKYTGNSLLQKKFTNNHLEKKKIKNRGELPMFYAEETHPAIISQELFDKAQVRQKTRAKHYCKETPITYSVFSGLIKCKKCGKSYRRITTNGTVGWNCSTYISEGKKQCHGKKIPDKTLEQTTAEALNMTEFIPSFVTDKIEKMEVNEPNHIIYYFKDGSLVEKVWKDRSRRESWTTEMKEKARKTTLSRNGGKTDGEKSDNDSANPASFDGGCSSFNNP